MRVAALWCLLALATVVPARADDTAQTLARRETFVMQAMLDGERAEIGGAVVIGRAGDVLTLATAAHLVRRNLPLRILDESRDDYYRVLDVSAVPGYDLALVRVRAHDSFPVQPAQFGAVVAGEAVWLWGHPHAEFWQLSTGTILDADIPLPGAGFMGHITIDCRTCTYGDSGSGVFSQDGKLLGILSSGWQDKSGRLLFVQVEPITPLTSVMLARGGQGAIPPIVDFIK